MKLEIGMKKRLKKNQLQPNALRKTERGANTTRGGGKEPMGYMSTFGKITTSNLLVQDFEKPI